jgi:hypothetical protein
MLFKLGLANQNKMDFAFEKLCGNEVCFGVHEVGVYEGGQERLLF